MNQRARLRPRNKTQSLYSTSEEAEVDSDRPLDEDGEENEKSDGEDSSNEEPEVSLANSAPRQLSEGFSDLDIIHVTNRKDSEPVSTQLLALRVSL